MPASSRGKVSVFLHGPTNCRWCRKPGLIIFTTAALLFIACDSAETGTAERSEISEPSAAGSTAQWHLSNAPLLTLGRRDGESWQMFHGVTDVTIAPTGEIIVADAGSREIRLYDVEGRHIRTFGGLGDGPGEFRMVHRVQTLDDGRLAAMDPVLRRVTVLDLREGLIRVTGIGAEHPQPLLPYRMLKDSLFIAHRGSANPTIAKGIDRERNEVLLVDTEAVRRTVVAYRGNEIYVDGSRVFTPPLGTRTMVVVNSHSVALADTDAPRIELYDLNGSVKRTISWKQEPFSVTAQQREVMRDEYLQSTQREARREILAAVGLPERHPIISELLFDREDDLWVRGVDPDGMRGGVWKVFDVDGSLKSEVEIPGDLEVHEIGRDYVVGVRRDAVGVERVVVYSLRR